MSLNDRASRKMCIQPGQDPRGVYQSACIDFADEHGWPHGSICYWWSQIALAREACGQPRAIAEWLAMRDVRMAFHELKIGNQEPD